MVKRVFKYLLLLTLVFPFPGEELAAQTLQDSLLLNSPIYREKLHLFTDRSLYAAGEQIHFSLYNLSHDLLKENNWSTVVYLELIGNHQFPVAQGKFRLDPGGAIGDLSIPDTVATGAYHLRAYTRWMRNFDAADYFHIPITVVNPRKVPPPEKSEMDAIQKSMTTPAVSSVGISCSVEQDKMGKREKGVLHIALDEGTLFREGYSVSIIREGYLDLDDAFLYSGNGVNQIEPSRNNHAEEIMFYPEIRGVSLSGQVTAEGEPAPAAFSQVHITILGPEPDYFGIVSDNSGRIHFSLPSLKKPTELLITSNARNGEALNLVLQDEYSRDFASPTHPAMKVSKVNQNLVDEIGIFNRVALPFNSADTRESSIEENGENYPFYGTPEFRYHTSDYIEIPNLEEFIFELIPQVQVEKQKRSRYFSIIDDSGPISEFAPLVLLDFVPIYSVENILRLAPEQIAYIDVINSIYIRGSNNYGGIINIVSKKGDLAGLRAPEGASLYTLNPLNEKKGINFQEYNPQKIGKRIPDLRTTLFWSAKNIFSTEAPNSIGFYTSDLSGQFLAVIRGINEKGEIVQCSCEFRVE